MWFPLAMNLSERKQPETLRAHGRGPGPRAGGQGRPGLWLLDLPWSCSAAFPASLTASLHLVLEQQPCGWCGWLFIGAGKGGAGRVVPWHMFIPLSSAASLPSCGLSSLPQAPSPRVPSFLDPHSEGLYSGGGCLCRYSPARCIRIRRFDDCLLEGGADRNIASMLSALVDC